MRGRRVFHWKPLALALGLSALLIMPALAASAPAGDRLGERARLLLQDPVPVPLDSGVPVSPFDPNGWAPEAPPSEVKGQAEAAFIPASGRPGIYAARDNANLDPSTYHIVGAHQSFYWKDLEPQEGNYNWAPLDDFIISRSALGKPIGIGLMTYLGRVSANSGENPCVVPNWFFQQAPNAKVLCTKGSQTVTIPKFWDQTYLTKYGNFVRALANHLRSNPSLDQKVEFIYMGVGAYGETQPCDDDDNNCLTSAGLNSYNWYDTVNKITDIYKGAFQSGGYYKNLLLLSWPTFVDRMEGAEFRLYAGQKGIGQAPAGMHADMNYVDLRLKMSGSNSWYGRGPFDYILGQVEHDSYWNSHFASTPPFPVAFEAYSYMTGTPSDLWWGILGALSRHADYITAERTILYTGKPSDPVKPPITGNAYALDFANKYLGRSLTNTPGVWAVMRESGCNDSIFPQRGNYNYWLYQDNTIATGATQAVSNLTAPLDPVCASNPANTNDRILWNQAYLNGPSGEKWAESYVCRKTQGASNPKIFFRVDDGFVNGGTNAVTIRVRYYDYGNDSWTLKYDGATLREQATATVHKTNSRTWKWQEFVVSDARFANGQPYGSPGTDFYIDSLGDGDEYIHMVEVLRQGSGTQTFDIPLSVGANLISLPLIPADPATTAVFNPIWGSFQKAYAYDINGNWKSYSKDIPINNLTTLDTRMGLWVYVNSACTLTVSGLSAGQSSIQLKGPQFGNIVGYPSRSERPLSEAFGGIWSSVAKVVEYTGATPKSYTRGVPVNSLTSLKPGHGYIIYVDANCTWTINQ